MAKKIVLPPWIEGLEREVLQAYIQGIKPILIQARMGVDANFINNARLRNAIPSQLQLRERGILPPQTVYNPGRPAQDKGVARKKLIERAAQEYIDAGGKVALRDIAARHCLNVMQISKEVKARGYVVPRGPTPTGTQKNKRQSGRNEAIIDAVINQRKTLQEVGDAQDPPISRERVRQICNAAGHKVGFRPEIMERLAAAKRIDHPKEGEIIQLLREDRYSPKTLALRFKVTTSYLATLRRRHGLPLGNRLNWRTDDDIEREQRAIDAYYNRPDVTSEWISHNILRRTNDAAITQLIKRRGLPRTRGKLRFGEQYEPFAGSRRRYSPELKAAVVEDYKNPNISIKEILAKHDISYATLDNWRRAASVSVVKRITEHPARINNLTDERRQHLDAELRKAAGTEKSQRAVARECGVSHNTAYRRALELGLTFGKQTNFDITKLDRAILEGHASGKSMKLLAHEQSVSFGRIQRRSNALGLVFPPKPTQILKASDARKARKVRES